MKLIKINTRSGFNNNPDIKKHIKSYYLVKLKWQNNSKSVLICGKFYKQWYGLTFGWALSSMCSIELDNYRCLGLWRITK